LHYYVGYIELVKQLFTFIESLKNSAGRPSCRWKFGCLVLEWIYVAQDTDHWRSVVSTVLNRRIP